MQDTYVRLLLVVKDRGGRITFGAWRLGLLAQAFIYPNVSNAFERAGLISLKISVLWILV